MATPETTDSSSSSNLQTQIGELTDQLIQLSLFETAKKFNLPLKREMFSAFLKHTKSKKIETPLYSLTITPDLHEVGISWTLHREELERRLARHAVMKKTPEWGFFGFIKERPFLASDLESLKDVREHADISTKSDGNLSFDLKEGVAYSALFTMVFDSVDAFVLDEDVTTMVQRPKTPTLDDIAVLGAKLRSLVKKEESDDIATREVKITKRFLEAAKQIAHYKETLINQFQYTEEQADQLAEGLEERLNDFLYK